MPRWESQSDDPPAGFHVRDRQGHRIDIATFGRLVHDPAYRRVAADRIGTTDVITIWHGWGPYSADGMGPMFSSIVVRDVRPGEREWGAEEWYETEMEALAGHARRVAELRDEEKLATWIRGRHQ